MNRDEILRMAAAAGLRNNNPGAALEVLAFAAMMKAALQPAWQSIDTAPQDGLMLVHEDEAVRLLLRIDGKWHKPGYPALVTTSYWGDVLVGQDAERILKPLGYRLEHRDGCCENPTHWMPCPDLPEPSASASPNPPKPAT